MAVSIDEDFYNKTLVNSFYICKIQLTCQHMAPIMQKINCALIAEDNDITIFLNQEVLKKLNVTNDIRIAKNGKVAITAIEEYASTHERCCPELILLDLNMPVEDGFEFLDQFNRMDLANKEKVKVILLTNATQTKLIEKLICDCSVELMSKPVTEQKLAAFLADA